MSNKGVGQGSDGSAAEASPAPVVLIVEDERELADLYAAFLDDEYTVRTAYTGEEALELLDHDVDVALLDRRLKGWSGDEFVTVIQDRKIDCQIAMVTAVNPDTDIVNIAIDEYLTKPVSREDLRRTVEELLLWSRSEINQQELLALVSRRIALETEMDEAELETSAEYSKLISRIGVAERRLRVTAEKRASSSYQPSACSECGLRWDVSVGRTIGVLELAAFVWKCTQCGHVEKRSDSHNRRVARR